MLRVELDFAVALMTSYERSIALMWNYLEAKATGLLVGGVAAGVAVGRQRVPGE